MGFFNRITPKRDFVIHNNILTSCNITDADCIRIPEGVTIIVEDAFRSLDALETLYIPDSVTLIKSHAFNYCDNLKKIYMSKNIQTIEKDAFYQCYNIEHIEDFPVRSNDNLDVFHNCFNLIITNKQLLLKGFCYSYPCFDIPEGITEIADNAFSNSRVESVTLPQSLVHIGDYAFARCSYLKEVSFSNSTKSNLKTIGKGAFSGCSKLFSITLPLSVEHISPDTFSKNTKVYGRRIDSSNPAYVKNLELEICVENGILLYSNQKKDTIIIPDNVKIIGENAYCKNLFIKKLVIPPSVTCIKKNAFNGCPLLSEVTFTSSLKEIGARAFAYCPSLKTIECTDSDTFIPPVMSKKAFTNSPISYVPKRERLRIEEQKRKKEEERQKAIELERIRKEEERLKAIELERIRKEEERQRMQKEEIEKQRIANLSLSELREESYYKYLKRIKEMPSEHSKFRIVNGELLEAHQYETVIRCTIPSGVKSIAPNAFENANIQELYLPEGLEEIHQHAFSYCFIKKIYLPSSLKYIEDSFCYVSGLKQLDIPANCVIRFSSADCYTILESCKDIETVTLPQTVEYVDFLVTDDCPSFKKIYITNPETTFSNEWLPDEDVEIELLERIDNSTPSTAPSFSNLNDLMNSFVPEKDIYGILCPDDLSYFIQDKVDNVMLKFLSAKHLTPEKQTIGNIRLIVSKTHVWIIKSFCCSGLVVEVVLKIDTETKNISFGNTYPSVDCYYTSFPQIWLTIGSYLGIQISNNHIADINNFLSKQSLNTINYCKNPISFINSSDLTIVSPNNVFRYFIK